jgi:hypothetical protein
MGDSKRTAERNAGAFLGPDLMVPIPVNSETEGTGRGEPGPEDEWTIPALPDEQAPVTKEAAPEPAHTTPGSGLLHRLTHRG